MKYFCFLIALIFLYYYGFKYYPERYEEKYHYYFSGFIMINFLLIYLFTYEKEFIYKLFYNMYSVSKQGVNLVHDDLLVRVRVRRRQRGDAAEHDVVVVRG